MSEENKKLRDDPVELEHLSCCPFCGGEAEFVVKRRSANFWTSQIDYLIQCSVCKCTPMKEPLSLYIELDKTGRLLASEPSKIVRDNAIKAWNNRVSCDDKIYSESIMEEVSKC